MLTTRYSVAPTAAVRRNCITRNAVLPQKCSVPRPQHRPKRGALSLSVRASDAAGATAPVAAPAPAITLTDNALDHLKKLKAENMDTDVLLRVGVRQGGCSGMSYHMDFEKQDNIAADDYVMSYDDGNFRLVCDPKSLLYLFGMRLDYSSALIGGGFQFHNPNAAESCGCGKSFGV